MKMIKRLAQSFLISGCLGVLVAVPLHILGSIPYTRDFAASGGLILCPGMILGLAEPTTTAEIMFLLAIVLGTNFILYGIGGLLLYGAWTWFRRRSTL